MSTIIQPTISSGSQAWQIDPAHTSVEFSVKHLMIAKVRGRFAEVTGTLQGDLAEPQAFRLQVDIATKSIDTRQEQRDAHLRSADFFDTDKWPAIRFVGKRIVGDVNEDFKLTGDLTIRDVTREIVLDVTSEGAATDPWGGSRLGFSATGRIDRRDFGLTWNQALEAGGVAVGHEVTISVDAELTAVVGESAYAA